MRSDAAPVGHAPCGMLAPQRKRLRKLKSCIRICIESGFGTSDGHNAIWYTPSRTYAWAPIGETLGWPHHSKCNMNCGREMRSIHADQ